MRSIAAENLEAKLSFLEEQRQRANLINPLHMVISRLTGRKKMKTTFLKEMVEHVKGLNFIFHSNFSALNPKCLFLIPNLLLGESLHGVSLISLHLLDLDGSEQDLQQLKRDTEELAFPRLHQVIVHSDIQQAFQKADVVILLDDASSDGSALEEENEEDDVENRKVRRISERYREYGRMIDKGASKDVKVIVAPDSYANLACSLVLENAPSVNSSRFVAVSTQLENEARAVIAKKLGVRTSGESWEWVQNPTE